ncbi:hypothetical protein G6F35_017385 [Rhizopus arrhizus]|nr:hypothetical protein G6F35_017385 [Rhizopus arrhizus]
MTVDECEELMASASPAFRKSMVSADGSLQSEVMSSGRTSESAACSGDLCARITDRAAELLGCASTLFEPIQCVSPRAHGHFLRTSTMGSKAGKPSFLPST